MSNAIISYFMSQSLFVLLNEILSNSVFLFVAFLDEAERKYLFECDSKEQCGEWIDAIIKAR